MSRHSFSILCLGDSYTVGEGVPLQESFPYQLIQLLRKKNVSFQPPEIVAKTGWTTFELADFIINHSLCDHYDFVILLIGVNNQYRELGIEEYSEEFEFLLKKAIHLADGKSDHVCVLSIPDWGVTPFAKEKNAHKIATAIDHFNEVNNAISEKYGTRYLEITSVSREVKSDPHSLAADGLHPSGKIYAMWSEKLANWILSKM